MFEYKGKDMDITIRVRSGGTTITCTDVDSEPPAPTIAAPAAAKPFGAGSTIFHPKRAATTFEDHIEIVPQQEQQQESKKRKVRARHEGAHALAEINHHPSDDVIKFDESTHTYFYNGNKIEYSVSKAAKNAFQPKPFNGPLVVENCYQGWVDAGKKCEYWDIISTSATDEEAKKRILNSWVAARDHGTGVHLCVELHMNRFPGPEWREHSFTEGEYDEKYLPELKQLDDWARSDDSKNLIPFRTELSTIWRNGLVAGQCDLLMYDTVRKRFVLIDLKRVKGKYSLLPTEQGYKGKCGLSGPMKGKQESNHNIYSLQLSMYSVMIAHSHGWDAGNEIYILRVHGEDRATYQWVKCTDFTKEAVEILDSYK
jgi:hypothetical protein